MKNKDRKEKISDRTSRDQKTKASAYGGKTPICINTDCALRKGAGGCFGFEGCPGFRSR